MKLEMAANIERLVQFALAHGEGAERLAAEQVETWLATYGRHQFWTTK